MNASVEPANPCPEPMPPDGLRHAGFLHDPDVAVAALEAAPDAQLLVVDAGGGAEAAFAHLAAGAAAVYVAALDNAGEVEALLRLEVEAFRRLERTDALKLLGLLRASRSEREALSDRVLPSLPTPARVFWARHRSLLLAGLFNTGVEARLGRLLRALLHEHLSSEEYRVLLYGDPSTRLELFDRRIAGSAFWRRILGLCAVRERVSCVGDPGMHAFAQGDPIVALREMVAAGLWSSPLWARAFCTDAGVLAVLPRHLQPEGYARLREAFSGLRMPVTTVEEALQQFPPASLDGIDLGGAPDHLEPAALRRLLGACAAALRPGRRLTCTSVGELPRSLPAALRRGEEAEARLRELDRTPMTGRRRVLVADGGAAVRY